MKKKQTSLFDGSKFLVHRFVPVKRSGKYPLSHYSYKQRLTKLINQKDNNLSWQTVYKLLISSANKSELPKRTKTGRSFVKTVNQKNLSKAVRSMRMLRTGRSHLSVNKIAKKYGISKPTLYRAYKKKYR